MLKRHGVMRLYAEQVLDNWAVFPSNSPFLTDTRNRARFGERPLEPTDSPRLA